MTLYLNIDVQLYIDVKVEECYQFVCVLELETKAIRRFEKVSIVSYSRPSLMIIASGSQFHVYLPWGQRPFSIVS